MPNNQKQKQATTNCVKRKQFVRARRQVKQREMVVLLITHTRRCVCSCVAFKQRKINFPCSTSCAYKASTKASTITQTKTITTITRHADMFKYSLSCQHTRLPMRLSTSRRRPTHVVRLPRRCKVSVFFLVFFTLLFLLLSSCLFVVRVALNAWLAWNTKISRKHVASAQECSLGSYLINKRAASTVEC